MPSGVFRRVVLVGNFAFKLPRLRNLRDGMRCNRWERELWTRWRPVFRWGNLCPIFFADRFGLLVVMPRASQPVTVEEVDRCIGDYYPDITAETKPADFGWVNGGVLVLDYGLPYEDMVVQRRQYYTQHELRQGNAA